MTTLPAAATIAPALLGSTQGQWWSADFLGTPQIERRVSLIASWRGFHLWTADFRNERTGRAIGQRFFATTPKSSQAVAVFDTLEARDAWIMAQ